MGAMDGVGGGPAAPVLSAGPSAKQRSEASQPSLCFAEGPTEGADQGPVALPAGPIVFVHGFAQSASTWEDMPYLGADSKGAREAFAFELVGHGSRKASGKAAAAIAPGRFDLQSQARDLLDYCCIATEVKGMPPVLVGYSMGARVVLEAACQALDEARSGGGQRAARGGEHDAARGGERLVSALPFGALVLESAGLGPVDEGERESLRARNASWAARLRAEGVEPFMDRWEGLPLFQSQLALPDALRAQVRAERCANDAELLALSCERAGAHAMRPREQAYTALNSLVSAGVPVTYVAGALDAKYCALARELQSAVPGARVLIAAGVGHNVHLECRAQAVAAPGAQAATAGV